MRSFLILSIAFLPSMSVLERAAGQEPPTEVAPDVFLLPGLGCNVVAVLSPEGVLLIDNGQVRNLSALEAQIAALGSGPVRIAIDTHFHYDHVGANGALGEAGATIIGHHETRARMLTEWYLPGTMGERWPKIPPFPETALPTLTFDHTLVIHFDAHEIEAVHFPNAHSDSDLAIYVRDRNVLHTGDLYLSNGFPILDSFHGGTIDGLLSALDDLIASIDEFTVIVPGHGPLSDRRGLQEYRDMLAVGKDRIADLISRGFTLDEVMEADPTEGLYRGGDSWLDPNLFVWTVFVDLTGRHRSPIPG